MKKYQLFLNYNFRDEHQNTASIKPIQDSASIAEKYGYSYIIIDTNLFYLYYQLFAYISFKRRLKKRLSELKKGDIVLIQYPIFSTYRFDNTLKFILSYFKKRGIYSIALIHDVENLRNFDVVKLRKEVCILNNFNSIIIHNDKMKDILKEYGLNQDINLLNVFDYLIDNKEEDLLELKNPIAEQYVSVVFAGNLNKSSFVNDLGKIKNVEFELFGNGYKNSQKSDNVNYHGSLSPLELNKEMSQYHYGLVWDGISIEKLDDSENFSRYMKYNNPFKLSSYISAGIPIITSKDAGIAKFVTENNIGIVVGSLIELENRNLYHDFDVQKRNISLLKSRLNNGEVLGAILEKIQEKFISNFKNN